MKILQVCSYYTDSPLYQNLFDKLENKNLNEDVYVFTSYGEHDKISVPDNVFISKCFTNFDRFIFHLKHFKVLRDITKTLDIRKYSLIHAHSLFSNGYIAYKLNQKYNIPYIVAVRNTDINFFFKRLKYLRRTGLKILVNAKKIIFLSESYIKNLSDNYLPDELKKEMETKSRVIQNGIDDFWLNKKYSQRKAPEHGQIRLVFAGKINRNKNIETILKTSEILKKKGYDVRLKIIGRIYDDKYKNMLNSHDHIQHIDHVVKLELIDHYRCSDIFIMPSVTETFGLVYAEAMTQGLPVIYSSGQGFDGYFEDGTVGYAVPCYDAAYISDCIIEILKDYSNISQRCLEKSSIFNWENISSEYLKVYNNSV